MFPGSNPLTFSKILTGISKTLNIAGQIVPIYNQVTPMINGAKKVFTKVKDINIKTINNNNTNKYIKNKSTTISSSTNKPVFFK